MTVNRITRVVAIGVLMAVVALTSAPAWAESLTHRSTARSAPAGFKEVSPKKKAAIVRDLWSSGAVSTTSPRCLAVYVARSSSKWGAYRLTNASGCPTGEGIAAMRKTGRTWRELSIVGSSLPCSYLADELRKNGAPRDVIRDFTRGWPCF